MGLGHHLWFANVVYHNNAPGSREHMVALNLRMRELPAMTSSSLSPPHLRVPLQLSISLDKLRQQISTL